jgi:hypothetical protein
MVACFIAADIMLLLIFLSQLHLRLCAEASLSSAPSPRSLTRSNAGQRGAMF